MKSPSIPLFILFLSFLCCLSAAQASPQEDLYIWKWPYKTPQLTPYDTVLSPQEVKQAPEAIAQKVIEQTKKEYEQICPALQGSFQNVEQYDLGKDGLLLSVLCHSDSRSKWSIYYRQTLKNKLVRLKFKVPKLTEVTFSTKKPVIVGFEETEILKNSYIDQNRLISKDMYLSDTLDHTRKEWIWKKGHGFILNTQVYARIHKKGKKEQFVLFEQK
ncbi:MAG: hypothetical protein CL916_13735 [Deltaproteobacteria bacterium]|nr:hypothetical protein [Deltaproteobacteria bacterium]